MRCISLYSCPITLLFVACVSVFGGGALADTGHSNPPPIRAWGASLFQSPMSPTTNPGRSTTVPAPWVTTAASPGQWCRRAVAAAEQGANIPPHLLAAIARVETGRADGDGGVSPWPWSINVEGVDHVYESKAAAMAAVAAIQATGVRSIDVGCLQVNLMYHPSAFTSLAEAFDPAANAAYAARFLTELFAKTGSWQRATAMYHSADPEIGGAYERRVAAVLPEEQRRGDGGPARMMGSAAQAPARMALASVNPGPAMPGAMLAGAMMPGAMMPGAIMPGAISPGMAMSGGAGAIMLGNRADAARVLPSSGGTGGRGLDAYRSAPIPVASLTIQRPPL